MGFTPNNLLQRDTYSDRQMAAVAVSRLLRKTFNRVSLDIVIPDEGHSFGVMDWERDSKVENKVMDSARRALKDWGFDDPVVALPCSSQAESVYWSSPSDFRMKLKCDG